MLKLFHSDTTKYEICIDEVGRGCLFGRTYVACVVLPRDAPFDCTDIKDSKKFSSKTKMKKVAEYIKDNALYYHVAYVENDVIDKINILQAVMKGMHECIHAIMNTVQSNPETHYTDAYENEFMAIIDGNYFKPYLYYSDASSSIQELPYVTIEKGDATYVGIAAASILAKVARDDYVTALCEKYPELKDQYSLHTNMGYGTKAHLDGIQKYGSTNLHRKSFSGTSSAHSDNQIENI
jgi:ribonuclease HII